MKNMYYKKIDVSSAKVGTKRFSQKKHNAKFAYVSSSKRKLAGQPERKTLIIDVLIDDRRYYLEIDDAEIISQIKIHSELASE